MKTVKKEMMDYLLSKREMVTCDLYVLTLFDKTSYYYTNGDQDVTYDGHVYKHGVFLIKREQTKLHSSIAVDTMTISIYATIEDTLGDKPLFLAGHDGSLDRATLSLSRCFFDEEGNIMGTIDLFSGITEVKSCGGIKMQLTVKSKVQSLSQEYPRRRYYPQGTYASSGGRVSSSSEEDSASVIAPFVPLKEVFL